MVAAVVVEADRRIVIGRIAGVFGVKGWMRVFSYTDPPENILRYGPWSIGEGTPTIYRVKDGAVHGRGIIAQLDGIDDRDVARRLIGESIRVPRARFGKPGVNEYYWSDLIGMRVVHQDGRALGQVEDLLETGANDVLVVSGDRRRLIPFLTGDVVKSVDFDGGVLTVDWDADF